MYFFYCYEIQLDCLLARMPLKGAQCVTERNFSEMDLQFLPMYPSMERHTNHRVYVSGTG